MHNTKNTLTMVAMGVFLVGILFTLERAQVLFLSLLLFLSFWLSIVNGKISFLDKLLNACAGFTLATILLFISRYTYYFKSLQFIRVKQLEEQNLEIERLHAQKDDVLAYVMHDLRAPLNNIKQLNKFIQCENPHIKEAKLIDKASEQAGSIINDLLDALKGDMGALQKDSTDLIHFTEAIVTRWKEVTKREIIFSCITKPVLAEINPAKMERVLDNLIQNAIKFSPVDKNIIVSLDIDQETAIITVRDFGIGIPKDKVNEVFQQFTSFGRRGLNGENSIGIGLHIAKNIVEHHKGTIKVESVEGAGTTFTIALPLGA